METEDLYIKKPSGFTYEVDDTKITPYIYQPTPQGVHVLCEHYSKKYQIDLRCLSLEGMTDDPENCLNLLKYFHTLSYINDLPQNSLTGIILSNSQYHVLPLLVSKGEEDIKIVVFDSTSEERIRKYFSIANLFSNATFYLNAGTRQVDASSCMTDAVCILKEAMQLENLFTLIDNKRNVTDPNLKAKGASFFHMPASPVNFRLFDMPEQLLLTAQSSAYVESTRPDYSIKLRGDVSLQEYRTHFRMQVSLTQGRSTIVKGMNSYLFKKSQEHRKFFDCYINEFNKEFEKEWPKFGLETSMPQPIGIDTDEQIPDAPSFREITSPKQFA